MDHSGNRDGWVGSRYSFLDRVYGGIGLLHGQSTVQFSNPTRREVGIALRNCGLRFHVLVGRPLAFVNARHSISRDVTAVIVHMVLIGLPIALVVRRFSQKQS
jgi:hypothetical protein